MRQSTPYENRYCTGCQCTTRHEVKDVTLSCLRCGVVKYPSYPSSFKEIMGYSSPHTSTLQSLPKVCCA